MINVTLNLLITKCHIFRHAVLYLWEEPQLPGWWRERCGRLPRSKMHMCEGILGCWEEGHVYWKQIVAIQGYWKQGLVSIDR